MVSQMKAMYKDASTKVMVNGIESRLSMLKRGSVSAHLQPTAIIQLDALSREIMDGSPIELFQDVLYFSDC